MALCLFTENDFSERDEIFLLIVRHGRHRVGGRRVEGQDVEDAAAVEEEARVGTARDQDLRRVLQASTMTTSGSRW